MERTAMRRENLKKALQVSVITSLFAIPAVGAQEPVEVSEVPLLSPEEFARFLSNESDIDTNSTPVVMLDYSQSDTAQVSQPSGVLQLGPRERLMESGILREVDLSDQDAVGMTAFFYFNRLSYQSDAFGLDAYSKMIAIDLKLEPRDAELVIAFAKQKINDFSSAFNARNRSACESFYSDVEAEGVAAAVERMTYAKNELNVFSSRYFIEVMADLGESLGENLAEPLRIAVNDSVGGTHQFSANMIDLLDASNVDAFDYFNTGCAVLLGNN